MTALSNAAYNCARRALDDLNCRMYDLYSLDVTPGEIFGFMVSDEDKATLAAAKRLGLKTGYYGMSTSFKVWEGCTLSFDMSSIGLPLPTDLLQKKYELDPAAPYHERIVEYVTNMENIAEQFATARAVLEMLNDTCRSPKQLRFFMPSIVPLLKISKVDELANELATTPIVRNAPNLPYGSRQALVDTNALIAKATLIPHKDRYTNYGKRYSIGWQKTYKTLFGVSGEMLAW